MDLDASIAVFALPILAMVLFLLVWLLKAWSAFREIRQTRHGESERARNARGLALLKSWLSPAQLRCYEKYRHFDVIGCDSGAVYRIHMGTQANVEQLDAMGRPVCAWCFVPEGDLVPGDVMLAQKIALETNERASLAVAVRHPTLQARAAMRLWPTARAY